jgi:hypothetical protein
MAWHLLEQIRNAPLAQVISHAIYGPLMSGSEKEPQSFE